MSEEEDKDEAPDVTWADQQKISSFSQLNSRLKSAEEKLEELKVRKEALDDLSTELELADEDDPVLYKIGETFLHMPHPRALKRLEKDKADIDSQVSTLSSSAAEYETKMKELKVTLYAKFGKAINLDD
ncbi:Prefoldin, subunit 4 [Athelia psychrophila]|uniref:Prefoldin subunit 4 n=1 Tax=Athelia psychrophila TaxID=1759441 RepID=A0A166X4J0_9AGAM|nr:Prefoldin, subunit 4 [Fibularhizoctonia sp. CBS 109695]